LTFFSPLSPYILLLTSKTASMILFRDFDDIIKPYDNADLSLFWLEVSLYLNY